MTRTVGHALAVAVLAAACTHYARADSAHDGPLRSVPGVTSGFAVNRRMVSWEASSRVLAADLDSGRRVPVATGGRGNPPVPMALSGLTVLWLDVTGGLSLQARLFTATPGRPRKRLAEWYPNTDTAQPTGTLFGGAAGQGTTLAFALYKLSPPSGNPDACYEKPCRRRVAGGGVFLITRGSLAVRRILPPAQAIAATDQALAAAVVRPGSVYHGKAQVVVKELSSGRLRSIGKPASVLALGLDRTRVAALAGPEERSPRRLRVWDVATGRLVRSFLVPRVDRVVVLAGTHAVLRLGGTIFTLNLRNGRRRVVSTGFANYGPWVSRRRVLWVESYDQGRPSAGSFIRSAPLPGPAG